MITKISHLAGSAEQNEQAAVKQDIRPQCGKTHVWVEIMKFLQYVARANMAYPLALIQATASNSISVAAVFVAASHPVKFSAVRS